MSLDLYSLRGRVPGAASVIPVVNKSLSRRRARMRSARPSVVDPCASSTLIGSGGSCRTPGERGRTPITPAHAGETGADHDNACDRGRKLVDDLAQSGRKDIDAAHDQHVVSAPDAADAW